jgi:hypothetical protein
VNGGSYREFLVCPTCLYNADGFSVMPFTIYHLYENYWRSQSMQLNHQVVDDLTYFRVKCCILFYSGKTKSIHDRFDAAP